MIFAKLKTWALAIMGAMIAITAVFKFGERSGTQKAKQVETERRLKSTKEMKEIEHEMTSQDDPYLIDTLNRFTKG